MEVKSVAVIGAGRMGSLIASKLPTEMKKIVIDKDRDKAREVAEQIEAEYSDKIEMAAAADMIMMVLPTPAIKEMVGKLMDVIKDGTTILNMATTAQIEPAMVLNNRDIAIIDTKIIGHAKEIFRGEPAIIVVNTADEARFAAIANVLKKFYKVVQGDSSLVETINSLASSEGIKAAVAIRKKLQTLNVDNDWINVAIRTVCAGTMKAFTEDDLGHFARELVKKLEQED